MRSRPFRRTKSPRWRRISNRVTNAALGLLRYSPLSPRSRSGRAKYCARPTLVREKLATRISAETRTQTTSAQSQWVEPGWEQAAPGIYCKLLATDSEHDRVSMLVRLDPGVAYPPHTHAGREELHLLEGELWIEDRKLYPGDYNRAEAGTADQRVWSETGCACVLITSTRDVLA